MQLDILKQTRNKELLARCLQLVTSRQRGTPKLRRAEKNTELHQQELQEGLLPAVVGLGLGIAVFPSPPA